MQNVFPFYELDNKVIIIIIKEILLTLSKVPLEIVNLRYSSKYIINGYVAMDTYITTYCTVNAECYMLLQYMHVSIVITGIMFFSREQDSCLVRLVWNDVAFKSRRNVRPQHS